MADTPTIESPEYIKAKETLFEFFKEHWKSPAHVIAMYDTTIQSGEFTLHKWQASASEILAKEGYTSEQPLELCIQAVNGSGKDRFVISPFNAWFMGTKKNGTITLTSSSGTQLTNQTEKYLVRLCEKINAAHQFIVFEIKQRHIKCTITGSEIYMFATDEAGKAEGYHPADPGAPFAIVINEAKTVKAEIFEALTRCTGFQYWLEISSPGKPEGHFYQMANSDRMFQNKSGQMEKAVKHLRITSNDCPHLGTSFRERLVEMYGESSPLLKSMADCDFHSGDESVVLPYDKYLRCIKYPSVHVASNKNRAGLDLSSGGDEQVLTVANGNKLIALHAMRIKDTTLLTQRLIQLFEQYALKGCVINADAGGLGIVYIRLLWSLGWKNVRAVYNNHTASNEVAYKNRGTEMWFNLASLVENQSICFAERVLKEDVVSGDTLKKQLCNRYFTITNSVAVLESKPQARAKGHPSPDRADSMALCFLDYVTPNEKVLVEKRKKDREQQYKQEVSGKFPSIKTLIATNNKLQHGNYSMKDGTIIAYGNRNNKESNANLSRELRQALNN